MAVEGNSGLSNSVPQQPESYLISISPSGVLVTARGEAGLFYGAQSSGIYCRQ
jgi:N-acetyl-beta-hexosaminidase